MFIPDSRVAYLLPQPLKILGSNSHKSYIINKVRISKSCEKNLKQKVIEFTYFTPFFTFINRYTKKKCLSWPGVQFPGRKAPIVFMNKFCDPQDYKSLFSQRPQGIYCGKTSTASKQNHEFETFHIKL